MAWTTGKAPGDPVLSADWNAMATDQQLRIHSDGSVELSADWDIGSGNAILGDKISARSSSGLFLVEDGDTGIFVQDSTGYVGILSNTPRRPLDIINTSVAQIRATYTDNSVYTDFETDSDGNLTITPTGDRVLLPVADAGGQVFNIFAYGTVDDTGVSDSYAAIQAAIDAAEAAGGGIVLFPAGKFKIDTGLDLPANVNIHLIGAGMKRFSDADVGATTLLAGTASMTMITITQEYGARIADMVIDGNNLADTAISMLPGTQDCRACELERLYIENIDAGPAIYLDTVGVSTFKDLYLYDIDGIIIHLVDSSGNVFQNITAYGQYSGAGPPWYQGIVLESGNKNVFLNTGVYNCDPGFEIGSASTTSTEHIFISCEIENSIHSTPYRVGWYVHDNSGNITLIGPAFGTYVEHYEISENFTNGYKQPLTVIAAPVDTRFNLSDSMPAHNLIKNGGFERWINGTLADDWNIYGDDDCTIEQTGTGCSDTEKYSGIYAVKMAVVAAASHGFSADVPLIPGHDYLLSVKHKHITGTQATALMYLPGGTNVTTALGTTTSWTEKLILIPSSNVGTTTTARVRFYFSAAETAASCYLDDIWLWDLTAIKSSEIWGINTGSTTPRGLISQQVSADAVAAEIDMQKTRGTITAPTVITTGDELGNLLFRGYSGADGYVTGAAIKGISEGTIATTRVPAHLSFWTGTDAAPTVLTERMRIDKTGKVGINNTAPDSILHIGAGSNISMPYFGGDSSDLDVKHLISTTTNDDAIGLQLQNFEGGNNRRLAFFLDDSDGSYGICYAQSSGAFNFAIKLAATTQFTIDSNSKVGIGTTGPDRRLDVLDASNPQLRLTYTDGSVYTDFQTDSNGDLSITPSGNEVIIQHASADTVATIIHLQKTRGTIASPTVITTGDELGNLLFRGYSGAGGYVTGAAIKGISGGTIATTRVPANLSFWTGTDAAPTVLTQRMDIDYLGNVAIGTAAIATDATDGFLYIPSCAGTPTGTPTTKTGRVPLVYDSTNHILYLYDGSWLDMTNTP